MNRLLQRIHERWRDELASPFTALLSILLILGNASAAQAQSRFSLSTSQISNGAVGGVNRFTVISAVGVGVAEVGAAKNTQSVFVLESDFIPTVFFENPNAEDIERIREALGTETTAVSMKADLMGALSFNAQSGLIEQRIKVNNTWITRGNGTTVLVEGLPAGVRLENAVGTLNGIPFVEFAAGIDPGGELELLLEFYSPTRALTFTPTITAVLNDGQEPSASAATSFGVNRALRLSNGHILIEFTSTPGARYEIQFSLDMTNWKAAGSAVTAAGKTVVWVDSGPPKTDLDPTDSRTRFYRIIQLP